MSIAYLSTVSGLPTGQASSTTVAPQSTGGSAAPAAASGATAGTAYETSTPGTYVCLVTYPAAALPPGSVPWVHWDVNGTLIDDPSPIQVNGQGPIKRGAGATIPFYVAQSADHISPFSGSLAARRSLDNSGFAACTNTPVQDAAANGFFWLTLTQAETDALAIALVVTGTGADPVPLTLLTTP